MIFLLAFLIWVLFYIGLALLFRIIPEGRLTKESIPIHVFFAIMLGGFGAISENKFQAMDTNYTIRLVEDNTIAPKLGQSYSFLSKPTLKRSFLKEYGDGTKIYFIGADAPRVR